LVLQKFDKPLNNRQATKMSRRNRTLGAAIALTSIICFPLLGADEGSFSVSIDSQTDLVISGPNGQTVASLASHTLDRTVTVGNVTLQVSYVRDANGHLTAILNESNLSAVALHFSVAGKTIDAQKAIVTLTFSPDLKAVQVDPGYVGTVEVDSHLLRAHSLADDLPVPSESPLSLTPVPQGNASVLPQVTVAPVAPTPAVSATPNAPAATPAALVVETPASAPTAPEMASPAAQDVIPAPESAPAPAATARASASTLASTTSSSLSAPPTLASEIKPILPTLAHTPSTENQPQHFYVPPVAFGNHGVKMVKYYWSEPITAPNGTAPAVASTEIRLVEVHGQVMVTAPGSVEQAGVEGMLVPSGSTVRTADHSSAALFMGGVNSARLMPNCELAVTQTLAGPVRTDVIRLQRGAVFSRIGHREGETENYSVATPEGTTSNETTDMLAFRGTPADLRHEPNAQTQVFHELSHLYAWNPAVEKGLISDVPFLNMGMDDKGSHDNQGNQGGPPHQGNPGGQQGQGGQNQDTYFYYCNGSGQQVYSGNIPCQVYGNQQGGNQRGAPPGNNQTQYVLEQILETLQPYNTKLTAVLANINTGTGTTAEQEFYHNLVTVFFCEQEPGIVQQFEQDKKSFNLHTDAYNNVLDQDLQEFGFPSLTPH